MMTRCHSKNGVWIYYIGLMRILILGIFRRCGILWMIRGRIWILTLWRTGVSC
ncbi:hypothetical protein BDV32DRAFT_118975, partial [Aspergillus pseudonomiae]